MWNSHELKSFVEFNKTYCWADKFITAMEKTDFLQIAVKLVNYANFKRK